MEMEMEMFADVCTSYWIPQTLSTACCLRLISMTRAQRIHDAICSPSSRTAVCFEEFPRFLLHDPGMHWTIVVLYRWAPQIILLLWIDKDHDGIHDCRQSLQ